MSFHVPEEYRQENAGAWSSTSADGNNGVFILPPSAAKKRPQLKIIASDGEGWEHVSVSTAIRCPTWPEMCLVKDLFWDSEDAVMQLHPPKSTWINNFPFCLHLWRPTTAVIPLPASILVGFQELNV